MIRTPQQTYRQRDRLDEFISITPYKKGREAAPLPVIGVDCDGVLASDRLLWQRMQERFPQHIPARYQDLQTFEWPRATEETTALCQELSADREFMTQLAPIPHMAEALRWLSQAGYRVHIITARPDCVLGATRRWLRLHNVSDCVEEIHCVAGGLAKIPLARELVCQAFVEDNHATAEAMGAAGIGSYLLDAPYNQMTTQHSRRMRGWRALIADFAAMPSSTPAPSTHHYQPNYVPGVQVSQPAMAF